MGRVMLCTENKGHTILKEDLELLSMLNSSIINGIVTKETQLREDY